MHFSISAKKLYIKLRNLFAKFIKSFRDNLSRPYFLANSNAIGVFCAMLPIVGQTYLCFLLWLVMRKFKATQFSLPLSVAWTFLTIPIFMPFILFGYYKLGCGIISYNSMSFREFLHRAEKIIRTSTDWEYAIKNGLKFGISGACHLEFYKGIRYNGLEINKTERRCGDAEKAEHARRSVCDGACRRFVCRLAAH